jgi:hypothetical protein
LLRCIGHYWHKADKPTAPDFVAYWGNNGQRVARGLDRYGSLFMEVYMAKRKRRAWTKKDIAELKAHSKSRTSVSMISKVMKRTVGALRRKAGIVGIRLGHRR